RLLRTLPRHRHLVEPVEHPVGGVGALLAEALQATQPRGQLGRAWQRRSGRGRGPGGTAVEQVVMVVERAGHALDPVRAEPEEERVLDRDAGQVLEGGLLEPGPEALPEL